MTINRTDTSEADRQVPETTADIIERLGSFDGPPEAFLANLLAAQCRIGGAESGAVLRGGLGRSVELIALYPPQPPGGVQPAWLTLAVEAISEVLMNGKTAVKPLHVASELYGQPARRHLILVPLKGVQSTRGLAAFVVETRDPAILATVAQRLELTISLLDLYEMRLLLQNRQMDLRRLRLAMETVAAINEHDRFQGLAMALTNELAARWRCDRVGLGFLKGRYVHLRAMSHTEKFSRKMKVVQDIEAAMEECLDQDVEVTYPAAEDATFVSRAAAELSRRHGPSSVLSVPLRHTGKVVAVLTLERGKAPFALDEAESIRLTADLVTPRLVGLEEHGRWFGARAALGLRRGLAAVVGPKHTWIKVAAIVILGVALFSVFGKGEYRVEAPFVLEPIEQQVVPAPFDGYLATVLKEPGEEVVGGRTVLATLETAELALRLGEAKAEQAAYVKQADAAASLDKTAEAQIARAQAAKVAAQIELLEYQIAHARIVSPTSGVITAGDLKRQIGAPVKTGDTLFEVAPLESLRAEVSVSQDDVADLRVGQRGELATTGDPGRRVGFEVERINPMSEISERKNVFKVRVRLDARPEGMRPGMEGLAKVDVEPQPYIYIWTRTLVNWVRMKLWL